MKYLKSLLAVFAAASLLFSFNALAQENANTDENGKIVRGAYETNGIFDNTYINLGAGVNSSLLLSGANKGLGGFGLGTEILAGKWWTPAIGARLGWHGFTNQITGTQYGSHFIHGDFVWNMFNSFLGYKETRFWSLNPFATMGVLMTSNAGTNYEYGAGVGFNNVFRLSPRVNVTLDLQALISKSQPYGIADTRFIYFPSATLGLAFNLGKTNFDRHNSITPVVIPVPFTTEQYNALADKVAKLEAENAALKDQIAALENELAPYRNLVSGQTYLFENGTFTAVDVIAASPITLYFDCGSAKLSQRELAHLEYFTENVVNADTKLAVNGYADKQTGSARRNQKLSEQRVDYVVSLLKKAGANEENIEKAAHGATVQLFDGAAKNRVVTVEVK